MRSKVEKKKKKKRVVVDHIAIFVIGLCYFFFPHEANVLRISIIIISKSMWNGLDFDQPNSGVLNMYGQLQNKQQHVILFDGIWYKLMLKA